MTKRSLISSVSSDWRTMFGSLDLCDCGALQVAVQPVGLSGDTLTFLKRVHGKMEKHPLKFYWIAVRISPTLN